MNKKLYFLDENEKDRILNLHESRTKKQYLLSEQKFDFAPEKTTKTTTSKSSTPAQKKFYDRKERVKTLDSKCSSPTPNDKNPLYKKLGDWMDYTGTGDSWGTGSLEGILKEIKNIQQYCEISATLKSKGTPKGRNKESIGEYLLRRIKYMNSWEQYFEKPLDTLLSSIGLNKTEKAKGSNDAWKKYPCVTTTGKKYSLPDGSFVYQLGGYYFYGNGRKMNLKTKEMSDFVCDETDNTKIKDFEPQVIDDKSKVVDNQANVEPSLETLPSYGVVTRNVAVEIPDLLKMAGMEGQPINQDTINKLYDILSKK
jgi:hypothetical protein